VGDDEGVVVAAAAVGGCGMPVLDSDMRWFLVTAASSDASDDVLP